MCGLSAKQPDTTLLATALGLKSTAGVRICPGRCNAVPIASGQSALASSQYAPSHWAWTALLQRAQRPKRWTPPILLLDEAARLSGSDTIVKRFTEPRLPAQRGGTCVFVSRPRLPQRPHGPRARFSLAKDLGPRAPPRDIAAGYRRRDAREFDLVGRNAVAASVLPTPPGVEHGRRGTVHPADRTTRHLYG